MPAPFGDGLFTYEPPDGGGLNITDLFHIVVPKPGDPGNDSRVDSKYPNVAIITPDGKNNRFGGMWAKEQLDLTMPFSTEIYLHLGHQFGKTDTVADGMTFTLHNDPAGLNAMGGAGEGLGVCRGRKWTGAYWQGYPVTEEHATFLENSLVIEFDTYRNLIKDSSFVDDPAGQYPAHCSLLIPRNRTIVASDHKNTFFFPPSQRWVEFTVNWTPNNTGGGVLAYTFDGHPESYTINSIKSVFGGTKVYWGFTGASGYYTSVQAAAMLKMPAQGITCEKTVKNEAGEDIDKGYALPGDILTYTVRVTARTVTSSIGPIVYYDEISDQVMYVEGLVLVTTKAGGQSYVRSSYSGHSMTVPTGQVLTAEGDWVEITFTVRVNDDAARSVVYNTAIIEAAGVSDTHSNVTEVTILAAGDPSKAVAEGSAAGKDESPVKVGDEVTYEISYTNFDLVNADIKITDDLPEGVDFVSSPDGHYEQGTHTVSWDIKSVPGGGGGKVSMVVRVNAFAVVKIENSAEVIVGTHEVRYTNLVENPVTPQNPEKKVSSTSAAGKDGSAVKLGDEITYEISYLNHEDTDATITIKDKLPDGVDYVSAAGADYDGATRTVTWTIRDVPSGGSGLVTLVVRVNATAVVRIVNSATVQVGINNPVTTNNVINPVSPENPVKKVSDSSDAGKGGSAVKVGDKITYEISYVNYLDTAARVMITDELPEGVDFVSVSNGGRYDDAVHTVIWTLTAVPSGARGVVSVTVLVNQRGVPKIENSAAVQVGIFDPLFTNLVENPVNPEAPVKKVSDKSTAGQEGGVVKVGDIITYDIVYRNYGETTATIIITDWLPTGVNYVSSSPVGTYSAINHTVRWTIQNVQDGDSGMVSVAVRVNELATVTVGNYATVQVGANNPMFTNYVENPIAGSNCPELIRANRCRRNIKGHKQWSDSDNKDGKRPPAVNVNLYRDGKLYKAITVSSTGNGSFIFGCLPIQRDSYHTYVYRVDEAAIPDGYTRTNDGYTIINTQK